MQVIVGLDNSISSPAVVIFYLDDNLQIVGTDYLNFCDTKKYHIENHIYQVPEYTNEFERIIGKNDFIVQELVRRGVSHYAIEGYSYGSCGSVFSLAENSGYLKMALYKAGIKKREYSPTTNKMFYTGKGNATKEMMIREFRKTNPLNLPETILNSDSTSCPLNDIVDAYALCYCLWNELLLRHGKIELVSLPDYQARAFEIEKPKKIVRDTTGKFKKPKKRKLSPLEIEFI